MEKELQLMPSTDFLKLYVADKKMSGELNGIRLCTIDTSDNVSQENPDRACYIMKRIDQVIPTRMFDVSWELTSWIYTGAAIVTSYAKGFTIEPQSGSSTITGILSQQSAENVIVAFEIDFGTKDANKWLFIVI